MMALDVSVPRSIILFFPPMWHKHTGDNTYWGRRIFKKELFLFIIRLLDLSPVAGSIKEIYNALQVLFISFVCLVSGRSGVFFSSSAWNFNFNNGNENYNNRTNDNNKRAFAVRSRV